MRWARASRYAFMTTLVVDLELPRKLFTLGNERRRWCHFGLACYVEPAGKAEWGLWTSRSERAR
jgi:hypothetical protein